MYKVYSKINKNKLIYIKYDKELKLDLKDLYKNISNKIDAIIIANPNSPIGDIIKRKRTKENYSKIK